MLDLLTHAEPRNTFLSYGTVLFFFFLIDHWARTNKYQYSNLVIILLCCRSKFKSLVGVPDLSLHMAPKMIIYTYLHLTVTLIVFITFFLFTYLSLTCCGYHHKFFMWQWLYMKAMQNEWDLRYLVVIMILQWSSKVLLMLDSRV